MMYVGPCKAKPKSKRSLGPMSDYCPSNIKTHRSFGAASTTFQCHAPFRLSTTFEWPFRLPLIAIFLFLLAPFRLPLIAIFLFLLGLQKP
mmetsp:Transcript_37008/g.118641  ORF Transcript_37008/g.118641 Transcript_37008/m.118641 type:complete len:90 (-) Transcript_37008:21-290(-)